MPHIEIFTVINKIYLTTHINSFTLYNTFIIVLFRLTTNVIKKTYCAEKS